MDLIIINGLISAFLILLISKIGLREYGQTYGPRLISKIFNCDFCLAFWINVIVSIILYIFVKDTTVFLFSFVSTPITRVLI